MSAAIKMMKKLSCYKLELSIQFLCFSIVINLGSVLITWKNILLGHLQACMRKSNFHCWQITQCSAINHNLCLHWTVKKIQLTLGSHAWLQWLMIINPSNWFFFLSHCCCFTCYHNWTSSSIWNPKLSHLIDQNTLLINSSNLSTTRSHSTFTIKYV